MTVIRCNWAVACFVAAGWIAGAAHGSSTDHCSEFSYQYAAQWSPEIRQADQPGSDIPNFMKDHGLVPSRHLNGPAVYVSLSADALTLTTPSHSRNFVRQISEVRYEVENNGEWGGTLSAYMPSGEKKLLLEGNVVELIQIRGQLVVVEGLAHGVSPTGSVYVIKDHQAPEPAELVTLLPDAPSAAYLDRGRPDVDVIAIAGLKSIMGLATGYDPQLWIISWSVPWYPRGRPTSIVRCREHYYVGLQSGLALVHPDPDSDSLIYVIEEN